MLSEDQQKKLADLVGSPFDLSKVLEIGCVAPDFRTVDAWINGGPYTRDSLRGKVTVIHFWTFGCINCIDNLPHYEAWREKYSSHKVAIIGFHTPETEAERSIDNVRRSVQKRESNGPWPSIPKRRTGKRGEIILGRVSILSTSKVAFATGGMAN